jgi:hypothetical protein
MHVVSVKKIKLKKSVPVYDATSPKYHNFVLACGAVVHNTAERARDKRYQEVLKLRGKILNIYRDKAGKASLNKEIIDILKSIGYDPSKKNLNLRVGKIILLADADPDGPLGEETRVWTLDGKRPSIKKVYADVKNGKEVYVWARSKSGEFIPAKVTNSVMVKKESYLSIKLDDGTVLTMTKNHRGFIYKGNKVIEIKAKNLKIGNSIPAKFIIKANSDGNRIGVGGYDCLARRYSKSVEKIIETRNQIHARDYNGNPLTVDEPLHHIAARYFYPKDWKKEQLNSRRDKKNQLQINHINRKKVDNRMCNLEFLSQLEHYKKDASSMISVYNKSKEHKELVARNNGKASFKRLQQLGKLGKYYAQLMNEYGKVNEKIWNSNLKRCTIRVPSFKNIGLPIENIKKSYKVFLKKNLPINRLLTFKEVRENYLLATENRNYQWALNTIEELKRNGFPLSPLGLSKLREKRRGTNTRTIGWKFIQPFLKQNHKIVSIEEVKKQKTFYCLTVPSTGNFYISDKDGNALLTGNCHITSLLLGLFLKVIPQVLQQGMVYCLYKAPLFKTVVGTKNVFGRSLSELVKKTNGKGVVQRIKGWGEINEDVLEEVAFSPKTRKLAKISLNNAKERTHFVNIMGEDVATRKKMLGV